MRSLSRLRLPQLLSRRPLSSSAALLSAAKRGVGHDFYIVDTTLREGEQHATTEFSRQDRVYIAKLLDQLGVDYIELVNPFASAQVGPEGGRGGGKGEESAEGEEGENTLCVCLCVCVCVCVCVCGDEEEESQCSAV